MTDMYNMTDMIDMDDMDDMNDMADIDSCNEDPWRGIFQDEANVVKAAPEFYHEKLQAAREKSQAAREKSQEAHEKAQEAWRQGKRDSNLDRLMRASRDAGKAYHDAVDEYGASVRLVKLACVAAGFTQDQILIWAEHYGECKSADYIAKQLKTQESEVLSVLGDEVLNLDFSHGVQRLQCLQKVLADECEALQHPKGGEVN